MSVLSIVEVEGPLPDVVGALQDLRPPPRHSQVRARWAGHVALLQMGAATGTAFWVAEDELTVVNINDRHDNGVAESVVKHLDEALPYGVTSTLRFVA
jgi:hypothetical protein